MKDKTARVPIMFEKTQVERIDDFAFANRIKTRSEAIRCLIAEGLKKTADNESDVRA